MKFCKSAVSIFQVQRSIGYFAFFTLLFLPITALSQYHSYQKFGVREGLASYNSTKILQDAQGQMLIGTMNGLSVYDGYQLKNLKKGTGGWIFAMTIDRPGSVWFITATLKLFHYENEKLTEHPANDSLSMKYRSLCGPANSITALSNDTLLLGFQGGPYQLKVAPDGKIVPTKQEEPFIYLDNRGSSLLIGYFSTPSVKIAKGIILNEKKVVLEDILCNGRIKAAESKNGAIFLTVRNRLYRLQDERLVLVDDLKQEIIAIHLDAEGDVWLGLRSGVEHRSPDGTRIIERVLRKKFCTDIFEDREGNMWFSTSIGVFKMIGRDILHYSESDRAALVQELEPNIMIKNDSVILQSYTGFFRLIGDSFRKQEIIVKRERVAPDPSKFHFTYRLGLGQLNGNSLSFISPLHQNYRGALFDEDGSYWSCREQHLVHFDKDGEIIFDSEKEGFEIFKNKLNIVPFGRVHIRDHTGKLWMNLGANVYTFHNDSFELVEMKHGKYELVRAHRIMEQNGVMWASTLENGLWAIYGDSVHHLSTDNLLPSNNCRALVEESDSVFWLATFNGLLRIGHNVKDGELKYRVKHFHKNHGLESTYIMDANFGQGKLWVSFGEGVSGINTQRMSQRETSLPPIQIFRTKVGGNARSIEELTKLKHDENNIVIDFKGITHVGSEKPTYEYRMLGANDEWRLTADTSVQLAGLAPGDYEFHVRTINSIGMISANPAKLSIAIQKPYWQTWWFIASILVGLQLITVVVLLTISKFRRRALISEKNTLIAELKALRLQVNPHFMFNALNNIREMVNEGDSEQAPQQLLRFSQLMRKILNASRKEQISLADEVDLIRSYLAFAKTRFNDKVEYHIHLSEEVQAIDEVVNIPPLITQPIVENALVHGASKALDQGTIQVNISKIDEYIRCQIIDNGPGFKEEHKNSEHTSIGMSLIRDQIEKLNASRKKKIRFSILTGSQWNAETGGTCVQLEVPIE